MQLGRRQWSFLTLFLATYVTAQLDSATPVSTTACVKPIDVIAVVDGSDSMSNGNYASVRAAVNSLVSVLPISPANAHFACVVFSAAAEIAFPFIGDKGRLKPLIDNLPHPRQGTNTGAGIALMRTMFEEQGRSNVRRVGIVLTDGRSLNTTNTAWEAQQAQAYNISMFAMGVGEDIDLAELRAIASSKDQVYNTSDFSRLNEIIQELAFEICPTTTTTARPMTITPRIVTTPIPITQATNEPMTIMPPQTPCDLQAAPGKPGYYQQRVGDSWMTLPCAPGTLYNPNDCRCSTEGPYVPPPARATTTTARPMTITPRIVTTLIPITQATHEPMTIMPPQGLCDNCKIVNGIGYNPHPYDHTMFVQCEPLGNGNYTIRIKTCSHGSFWNQDKLVCDWPVNVNSPRDPCRNNLAVEYGSSSNCRGFWRCYGGVSYGLCCAEGQTYSNGVCRAQTSGTCNDSCGAPVSSPCDLQAAPGKPGYYQQRVWNSWMTLPCAPGTLYNPIDCRCSTEGPYVPPPARVCRPEVYLPFNGDIRDESGNENYIDNVGVKVVNGTAYFDGSSVIRIPRLANVDFITDVVMQFSFKETIQQIGRVALVTNADCGKGGSLYVARESSSTVFGLSSDSRVETSVAVPFVGSGWQNAEFHFRKSEKSELSGKVNGVSSSAVVSGKIGRSQCALQLGHGYGFLGFIGYLNEVKIYLCDPL